MTQRASGEITQPFIDDICRRICANQEVTEPLPMGGRIHIDRQLPFLCLYRRPAARRDEGTEKLVLSEASYIIAEEAQSDHGLDRLVEAVVKTAREEFGAFLLLEIFSLPAVSDEESMEEAERKEAFCIYEARKGRLSPVVEKLKNGLSSIRLNHMRSDVSIKYGTPIAPPGMKPLLAHGTCLSEGTYMLGLGVRPIYQDGEGALRYPMELEALRREMSVVLKKGFFIFVKHYTDMLMVDYRELGRKGVTKVVFEVDAALAEIEDSFDFLLQVSPVNSHEAFKKFKQSDYEEAPQFYYRPRPFDPALMKRRLFEIPIEEIEDPVLSELFAQKRDEIDRKLTMLADRETPNFLPGSIQIYGAIDASLLQLSHAMMDAILAAPAGSGTTESVDTVEMARVAREEIAYYRKRYPEIRSRVEIRDDITSGAMVSNGDFLIYRHSTFPKNRVEALINHEIGTHILTYYNGYSQPFKQLHTGLCGYDEMQEGIAILSEYLCGGLTLGRLKTLAARVIAVDAMIHGAGFVETFRMLRERYRFTPKGAFGITTRVYRGGGLTKDAVYLRGFVDLLTYLHEGGKLDLLFIGKIAASHIPLVQELLYRKVLHEPPLYPRYLESPEAKARLQKIREGLGILDMITKEIA